MRPLSSSTRSISNGEVSWGDEYSKNSYSGKRQSLIKQANTVPLIKIFKKYNLNINEYNKKAICPFPNHSNGKESTPSMMFYPETNSFFCFGCKIGGQNSHGCEFVAEFENIDKLKAAEKIIRNFTSDIKDIDQFDQINNSFEKLQSMLEFSNLILEFRQNYKSKKSYDFIENICFIYDSLNYKHNLDNKGLDYIYERLKELVKSYEGK